MFTIQMRKGEKNMVSRKKILTSLLALVLVLALAACTPKSPDPDTGTTTPGEIVEGGVATFAFSDDPDSTNVIAQAAQYDNLVNSFINDWLVETNYVTGEYEPSIAESWETSEDGKTWTVKINQAVKWSDGVNVTADDVIFSWDYFNREGFTYSNYWGALAAPEGLTFEKVDEYTFTASTPEPYGAMIGYFSLYHHLIAKHYWEDVPTEEFLSHEKAQHPLGCGPFIFEEYKVGEYVRLTRNENYWRGKPYLDEIIFRIIPDAAAQVQAFELGELQAIFLTVDDYARLKDDDRFNLYVYQGYGTGYLNINTDREHLSDLSVRQAMAHLVDSDTIIENIFQGAAVKPVSALPDVVKYSNRSKAVVFEYSPEKAAALLEGAGYAKNAGGIWEKDGSALEFEVLYTAGSGGYEFENIILLLQQDFADAGIKLNLNAQDSAVIRERRLAGDFDFLPGGYNLGVDSTAYKTAVDVFTWRDPEGRTDALWTQLASSDEAEAQAAGDEIARIYYENVPALYLICPNGMAATQKNFSIDEALTSSGSWFVYKYLLHYVTV
jgi:peptide/nickel transport system substrate-binding protein